MSLSHFIYNPNCSSPMLEQLYNCIVKLCLTFTVASKLRASANTHNAPGEKVNRGRAEPNYQFG